MLPVKLDNARKRSWIRGSYELKIKVGVAGSPIRIVLVKMLHISYFTRKVSKPWFSCCFFFRPINKNLSVTHTWSIFWNSTDWYQNGVDMLGSYDMLPGNKQAFTSSALLSDTNFWRSIRKHWNVCFRLKWLQKWIRHILECSLASDSRRSNTFLIGHVRITK